MSVDILCKVTWSLSSLQTPSLDHTCVGAHSEERAKHVLFEYQ